MSIPVVLNEPSCAQWPDSRFLRAQFVNTFAKVLAELGKLPRKVVLLSEARMGDAVFGRFTLRGMLGEGICRDEIRLILAFANRSPFSGFGEFETDGSECSVDGVVSKGAQFAFLLQTAAISFASGAVWADAFLDCEFRELDSDANVIESRRLVPNLACAAHVLTHSALLLRFTGGDALDTSKVWSQRLDWFPSLLFLDRVEHNLNSLGGSSIILAQVVQRLFELESAIREWDPASGLPRWMSKVSPESESRQHLCTFVGPDGLSHLYDWHARYTPTAGRIHFRLIAERRCAEVGYIGTKL